MAFITVVSQGIQRHFETRGARYNKAMLILLLWTSVQDSSVARNVSQCDWMAFKSVVSQGIQRHLETRGAR